MDTSDKELICGYACPHWELADECAGCGYCTVKGHLTKIGDPCDVTTSKLSTVPRVRKRGDTSETASML